LFHLDVHHESFLTHAAEMQSACAHFKDVFQVEQTEVAITNQLKLTQLWFKKK
jgi:hypothetical protein